MHKWHNELHGIHWTCPRARPSFAPELTPSQLWRKVNRFRRHHPSDASRNRLPVPPGLGRIKLFLKSAFLPAIRTMAPTQIALTFTRVARAQGTMDFSGAATLMNTFKTFAIHAGAVICFGGLIFAGIRMMRGCFQDAIHGLFCALFWAAEADALRRIDLYWCRTLEPLKVAAIGSKKAPKRIRVGYEFGNIPPCVFIAHE